MRSVTPTLDWDFFLDHHSASRAPMPRVPIRERLRTAARVRRALRMLRTRGWVAACAYLQTLPPGAATARFATLPDGEAIRLARREIFHCQLIVRTTMPTAMCLPRSLALAVHLRTLGLPAHMTLARTLNTGRPQDTFHSWTELHGTVLNDKQDIVLGFTVLQRIPAAATALP